MSEKSKNTSLKGYIPDIHRSTIYNCQVMDETKVSINRQTDKENVVYSGIPQWNTAAAAAAESLQSCPTLCDPIDGSPPGPPDPGILQARTLE